MQAAIIILISSLVAFLTVWGVYFKILKIAKTYSLVDNPDERKLQKRPVPVMGGLAVFFGLVVGVLAGASATYIITGDLLFSLAPIMCAIVLMIYTGAMDDMIGLTPRLRFFIEIIAVLAVIFSYGGCIDSFHGLWGIGSFSWWIAVPLTVFACVGIINAFNLIDGVNGLCSGLCILCSILFGYMFLKVGELPNAVLAFSSAAAAVPFLLHNVFGKKSRMFLGDAGSMLFGMLMVWFTISVLRSDTSLTIITIQKNVNMIAMVLAILSVPVFDTVRVITQRMYHGQSPFQPDKTHLHHIFIKAGVSHSITTLIILFINSLIVLLWALSVKCGASLDWQLYVVLLSGFVLVWGLYFFFSWHERHHTAFMHKLTKFGIKTHLGHSDWWLRLEKWLDAPASEDEDDSSEMEEENAPDQKLFYDFLKGKSEVFVEDIKKRSGGNPDLVDGLVDAGIRHGSIAGVKSGLYGVPSIITLKEE